MKKFLPESLLWKLAAIGIGLITGTIVIALMIQLNYLFYPVPEDSSEMLELYLGNPVFLFGQLIAIVTGCFIAGAITKLFFMSVHVLTLFYTAVVLMLLGIIDLFTAPYPLWYCITALLVYIPAAIAGAHFIQRIQNHKPKEY